MQEEPHTARLAEALRAEAAAQRALLDGDAAAARGGFAAAADAYRASWECAPPRAYGRLIGMLKAAVLAGDASEQATAARAAVGDAPGSPAAWYARGLAALIEGDDATAVRAAAAMRAGDEAFGRSAAALQALAERDARAYRDAVQAIVADFERRDAHLTGVPFADTALMYERIAEPLGLRAGVRSPLLPEA